MASHPMAGSEEGLRKEIFGAKVDRGGPFANSKLERAWRVGGGFGQDRQNRIRKGPNCNSQPSNGRKR